MAVHEEPRGGPLETREEPAEQVRDLGLGQVALSDLDQADAAGDRRLHDLDQIASLRLAPIGHEHDTRQRGRSRGSTGVGQRPGSRPAWTRPSHGLDASA